MVEACAANLKDAALKAFERTGKEGY